MISCRENLVGTAGATLLALWAAALQSVAQSPPSNDEFTNRIALAGSQVVWTGNTVGATENSETDIDVFRIPFVQTWSLKSVWWSWTPPVSSTAAVEILGDFALRTGCLAVYSLTEGESGGPLCYIELPSRGQYALFPAEAGREYQIRLNLEETNDVSLRLTVTNAPIFRLQPRTQTVSSNASVLFTSWAFGVKPLHYQWRYNGVDVPHATNAMLPVYSANATNAGEYCVVVSSAAGGVSTSAVAQLIVSSTDPLPSVKALRMTGGTNFEFSVTGEEGRSYLVEVSTNLTDWAPGRAEWPAYGFASETRLVINNSNASTLFQVRQDAPRKFFRFLPYHPKNEICNSNLKQLWFANWQFAEEEHINPESGIWQLALIPYLINREWPRCPFNPDIYLIDYIVMELDYPTYCAYGHYLEEPF